MSSLEATDSDPDPERVAASLHHVHLPKLASPGVVEYDAATGTVRVADLGDRFQKYLAAAEDEHRPLRRTSESASLSEF